MALSLSGTLGLTSPVVLTIIVLVVVLIPVLRVVERRVANPVLHPELFARRDFPVALLQGFLVMLPRVGGAVTAVGGLYFQGMHGDSAAVAAVKTVTFPPVLLTVGSLTGGRVRNLLSNRTATIVSAVVAAVGMAVMLLSVPLASDLLVIIGLGILGLGNGVFQTLNSSTIVTSAPPKERASVVNAIRSTGQTFSTGIGLALAMALILAFAAATRAPLHGRQSGRAVRGRPCGDRPGLQRHLRGDAGPDADRCRVELGPAVVGRPALSRPPPICRDIGAAYASPP